MAARKLRDAYGKNKRKYWAARNKKYLAGKNKDARNKKINAGQLFSLAAKIIKRQKEIISAVYFGPISFPICGFVL